MSYTSQDLLGWRNLTSLKDLVMGSFIGKWNQVMKRLQRLIIVRKKDVNEDSNIVLRFVDI